MNVVGPSRSGRLRPWLAQLFAECVEELLREELGHTGEHSPTDARYEPTDRRIASPAHQRPRPLRLELAVHVQLDEPGRAAAGAFDHKMRGLFQIVHLDPALVVTLDGG